MSAQTKLDFGAPEIECRDELAVRGVRFSYLPAGRLLNRCGNQRMPFRWTINPYRGCEFGCLYCYARYTHEFLELNDPTDFERRILVKQGAARALVRDLTRLGAAGEPIAIGTATDPYQPAERKFGVTRSILGVFAGLSGLELSVTTKSALIVRDLDLLAEIGRRSRLTVNFSLITLNRRLQRVLEPRAPRPALRLRALSRLARGGIRCCVLVMPVIPGLSDEPAALERLLAEARRAGASAVYWRSLFLRSAAARRFLPLVRERFSHLAPRIEAFYGRRAYPPQSYEAELGKLFDRLREKCGFHGTNQRSARCDETGRADAPQAQLRLLESRQRPGADRSERD
ncbi:MAG: radical SAM protein [Deltaproteobacteria bacterium]|nr:radical SAM protein [Deltaproteobacteria bacterium]